MDGYKMREPSNLMEWVTGDMKRKNVFFNILQKIL